MCVDFISIISFVLEFIFNFLINVSYFFHVHVCVAWNRASRRSVPESLTPVTKSESRWQLSSTCPLKAMHKKTSTPKVTHEKRLIDIL